jgi:hypothetical protein
MSVAVTSAMVRIVVTNGPAIISPGRIAIENAIAVPAAVQVKIASRAR